MNFSQLHHLSESSNYQRRQVSSVFQALAFILCLSLLVACTNSTEVIDEQPTESIPSEISPSDSVVLIIATTGGCIRMGPNCPRYELQANGEFTVYREGEEDIAGSGKIDETAVAVWLNLASGMDYDLLRKSLEKGECRACFDGVDVTYTMLPKSKNEIINSREYKVDSSVPFFKVCLELQIAMEKVAPLEIKSRY